MDHYHVLATCHLPPFPVCQNSVTNALWKELLKINTAYLIDRLCSFKRSSCHSALVTLFWQRGKGGKWQVIWCLRRPQIIHYVGSLCISAIWLFNFFLVKRTLKQELQVQETSAKKDWDKFFAQSQFYFWKLCAGKWPQNL